jgi:hypothetical protein
MWAGAVFLKADPYPIRTVLTRQRHPVADLPKSCQGAKLPTPSLAWL